VDEGEPSKGKKAGPDEPHGSRNREHRLQRDGATWSARSRLSEKRTEPQGRRRAARGSRATSGEAAEGGRTLGRRGRKASDSLSGSAVYRGFLFTRSSPARVGARRPGTGCGCTTDGGALVSKPRRGRRQDGGRPSAETPARDEDASRSMSQQVVEGEPIWHSCETGRLEPRTSRTPPVTEKVEGVAVKAERAAAIPGVSGNRRGPEGQPNDRRVDRR
jgi:hypothetical protein